ncbi:MAG: TIGR02444 family protein, partial [Gammaproteobacteria bacterium]
MLFWNYSIKVYAQEGVPNACLTLQDKFALDVNLILFCSWYGISIGNLDKELFCRCHEYCYTWSNRTVKPLRNIRTWLKDQGCKEISSNINDCMRYRDKIKSIELEAEKMQQLTLESISEV